MARQDLVDDEAVLTAAHRLQLDGIHPNAASVTKALNWRWTESTVSLALARLRHAGRLVVTTPPPRTGKPGPRDDPEEIARRAWEVRYQGVGPVTEREPENVWRVVRKSYWTKARRKLYRRDGSCR